MNRKSIFKTASLSAATLLTAACIAGFAGCKDGNSTVLKPIAEHIMGKWSCQANYRLTDGKWVENEKADSLTTWIIRPDGSTCRTVTHSDGWTVLESSTWTADDSNNRLILDGKQPLDVLCLTADSFELSDPSTGHLENGAPIEGEQKWRWVRMDENKKLLVEKLVGKWSYTGTYEKKNGEWAKSTHTQPEEAWYVYKEDGTVDSYARGGDRVGSLTAAFATNETSGKIRWRWTDDETGKDTELLCAVILEDDGQTYTLYYDEEFDPVVGKTYKGEFKDILVRVQK